MLSCWPELAEPNEVLLRKSQVKFNSDQETLNVIRVSFASHGKLTSRQPTTSLPSSTASSS
jgi:hypothetical protein